MRTKSFARRAAFTALACHVLSAAAEDGAPAESAVLEEVRVEGRRSTFFDLDAPSDTGSRLGLAIRDLPASVSIVTQQSIQLHGARTALEAIEGAVGMSGGVGVGSIPSYQTRGFSGNDVTIMHDGIRQNTSSQASRPLDSFLFDRIEVLKGPASLLHGEGAIGGAVNYVSKRPGEMLERELLLNIGSWGRYRAAFGAGGPTGIDGLGFRADVSTNRNRGYVKGNDETYTAGAATLEWAASERTLLRFSFTAFQDDIESYYGTPVVYDAVIGADGTQEVRPANTATDRLVNARIEPASRRLNYNVGDNGVDATNTFSRIIVETRLTDDWTLRNETYAATQRLDWRNAERNTWNPVTGEVDRGSFFLIWRRDLQLGNRLDLVNDTKLGGRPNRFLVGILYDHNDQDRNSGQAHSRDVLPASVPLTGFDPGVGPDVEPQHTVGVLTRTTALYVEDALDVTPRLKLVGGLRYDRIDVERTSLVGDEPFVKSYSPVTGRVGFTYALGSSVNLYASYSLAAQPVSQLVSLTAAHEDFSLQKGRQYEAGVKASFWQDRADVTFAVFDIEKNDLLTSTLVDGERINSQIGAQVSQGMEWSLGVSTTNGWRVGAHLAWTWKAEYAEFNENLGTGVVSRAGNTPPNVPEVVAGIFASRDWGPWSVTANAYHVGEREANNNNGIQLDGYVRVDASVSRRWEHFSMSLRGRNLTDETYAQSAGAGGLMWRLADPRSAEIGLRYEF